VAHRASDAGNGTGGCDIGGDLADRTEAGTALGQAWDFGKIRIFAPSERGRDGTRPAHAAPASPCRIQPKLTVGTVDDPLEREADRLADRVMRSPDPRVAVTVAPPQVTRKCDACAEEDKKLQRKPAGSRTAAEAPGVVDEVLRSPGQSLDQEARAFFEPRFGHDFSRIRVHTDAAAAQSAAALGAAAYTVGSHVAFAAGRYSPATDPGRRLLAHELVHTIQQRAGAGLLRRQTDLDTALANKDWPNVAEILNGYNPEGIARALGKLSRGLVASIHQGAIDNPRVGPDSAIAIATRPAYLDINYENELKRQQWDGAAYFLNGFNRDDIDARLQKRSIEEVQALHDGAVANPQVGDKSQLAQATEQEIAKRQSQPATAAPVAASGCDASFKKATSFQELIDLVRAAEAKLAAAGVTAAKDQIHALRGIYYGTTWSLDYTGPPGGKGEGSATRNEGFQRFTRPSEPAATSAPRDVRTILNCGLFGALKASQDMIDPGGRQFDFGHLIIGLDARSDPAFASKIKYPVPTPFGSIDHELGGTGTELVTWVGDLGGATAMLAIKRVAAPTTSASAVFTGSDYGGAINLEGDVAGSVVATASPSAVTAPSLAAGKGLSDVLQDYLTPAAATPSTGWSQRATTFLTMNGGTFDASGVLTNRDAVIAAFAKKFEEFSCDYLASRIKDKHIALDDAKTAASSHIVSSSLEVATVFVDALVNSSKSGGKIEATHFPPASSGGASACTTQLLAAQVLGP
jgi:Domain of unknown function (DUF4157)